ncbi:MAG: protein-L-isoaspartate(D-aspartate) O-methyltransferase [Rickettsiales bacterium]|nr:protein-L-isoaspartate(D-aspartate) O-methyltransferase [Rickettsiales bacterium]
MNEMGAMQAEKIRLLMHLRRQGINDTSVLGVIEEIPRELFVSDTFRDRAYDDEALPIEKDQTISQPTIVALMTEALRVNDRHMVLEVGTGSGYQAAILSKLARRVYTIERHQDLLMEAQKRFDLLKLRNITTHYGDGSKGWKPTAPYDRIIVTAAAADVPTELLEQLRDDGVMVVPIGMANQTQTLYRITKEGETYIKTPLADVRFVPLVEKR